LPGNTGEVSPKPTIAVLGTGTIGLPVARNLARAGFAVRAWNRTREKADPLAAEGVSVQASAAEAVADVDVLITFLADGAAVEEVMAEAAPAARSGATWIQSSTIGIVATDRLIEIASDHELVFVDAPVLGTKEPAEKGELVVFASGPEEARELCDPIFDETGKATRWVGEAGAGQRFKLVVNTWLLAAVEGAAETISLAQELGLDPKDVLDALSGGPLDMPYLQLKGKAMIERSFDPSFKASLAEKDAGLVLEAAGRSELELPLVEAVREAFERAVELGHGDEDMAAVVEALQPRAA
jgi:3-hydroxyisobutyrate dehydrogenase